MENNLARAVRDKQPVPEIDFSLHQMEDGSQVSTLERVVKGNLISGMPTRDRPSPSPVAI
jgi:hypothetical protein